MVNDTQPHSLYVADMKRTPFHPILMHFAARHHGTTYAAFASDYHTLVEANIHCFETFGHDAVSVISDPYRETSAFGATIDFPTDAVPICRTKIICTQDDLERLANPDVHTAERTRDRIEGVRYYRALLGDITPVIGWIEGPLAEACDLAGVNEILLKLAMDPGFVSQLMDICLLTAKDFALAQIEAGSDIMGVGDAICSQISAVMYRDYVLPLHQELFETIHEAGARVKLHICGDINHLLPEIAESGADIIDCDWMVDCGNAHAALGPAVTVCGNLDPVSVIQNMSADKVYEASFDLVQRERDRLFILSGGCEITVNTPDENLHAMRHASEPGDR